MVSFNPIGAVGDPVGVFVRWPPIGGHKWIPATIESISCFSSEPGVFVELYSVRAINSNGYSFKKTVRREHVSTCKHLFKNG
mgnify:CR=1 FL=1